MKYTIAFLVGFWALSLSAAEPLETRVKSLEAQIKTLTEQLKKLELDGNSPRSAPPAEEIRRDYFANDQHDNYKIQLVEALSEREHSRLEDIAREIHLVQLRKLGISGAIPAITLATMEHEAKKSTFHDGALDFKIEAIHSKLHSLEALLAGDALGFLKGDADTNKAQWESFRKFYRMAQEETVFRTNCHKRHQELSVSGAVAWAKAHYVKLDMDRAIESEKMWKEKVAEQEAQYRKALEELKKAGGTKP